MNAILRIGLAFFALALLSGAAFAGEGESIVLDPATGNYVITHYVDSEQRFEKLVFVPATKIDPALKSDLKLAEHGDVHYTYTLASGKSSQQVIVNLIFDGVSSASTPVVDGTPIPDMQRNPSGEIAVDKMVTSARNMTNAGSYIDRPQLWNSTMTYTSGGKAFRIGWYYDANAGGLRPGDKAAFGLKSRDLPGIVEAEVHGYAPDTEKIDGEELPDEPGDDPFWKQYFSLMWHNFVTRPAAVPLLAATTPLDGVSVLNQLKANVATWPGMKLVDASTANEINSRLQTAINDLSSGNNEAAILTMKSIRSQLNQLLSNGKRDSEMPRDKQAAKGKKDNAEQAEANRHLVEDVLQFDLKYICRALGADEKMDEDERR